MINPVCVFTSCSSCFTNTLGKKPNDLDPQDVSRDEVEALRDYLLDCQDQFADMVKAVAGHLNNVYAPDPTQWTSTSSNPNPPTSDIARYFTNYCLTTFVNIVRRLSDLLEDAQTQWGLGANYWHPPKDGNGREGSSGSGVA